MRTCACHVLLRHLITQSSTLLDSDAHHALAVGQAAVVPEGGADALQDVGDQGVVARKGAGHDVARYQHIADCALRQAHLLQQPRARLQPTERRMCISLKMRTRHLGRVCACSLHHASVVKSAHCCLTAVRCRNMNSPRGRPCQERGSRRGCSCPRRRRRGRRRCRWGWLQLLEVRRAADT
jgi:hypothetical protein